KVVAAMMRVAAKGFKANVHQGGQAIPVNIGPDLENLAVETAKICGLNIAGVDVLLTEESYVICEINSSPGFQGLEKSANTNVGLPYLNLVKDFVLQQKINGSHSQDENTRESEVDGEGEYVVPVLHEHLVSPLIKGIQEDL